jgi:hypothetical protein
MNDLVLNCHAEPQTRELSAAELDTVGGGVGPLLVAGMLIDGFLVGFNIGMRVSADELGAAVPWQQAAEQALKGKNRPQ